jgi:N-hydroxyarylamine O-acetyltransferase
MDTVQYLKRINYGGSQAPTLETLRQLQLAHLMTIPFENLSIHIKEPIVLQYELLYDKIVKRRRGGFCYELNGLFSALLNRLGFNSVMLPAGVANNEGEFSPDFDHMTLMVLLEERWLVDVGFGDSFRQPLLIDNRAPQFQGNCSYRIDEKDNYLIMNEKKEDSDWKPQYRFTLKSSRLSDFEEMCNYNQTSPDSHFTQKRICSIARPNGRVTLSDMRLIETSGNEKSERLISDEAEYAVILLKEFGIIL